MPCLMLCFWYATWVCAQLSEGLGQTGQDLIKCCVNFKPPDSSQSLITRSPKTSLGPKKKKKISGQWTAAEHGEGAKASYLQRIEHFRPSLRQALDSAS